MTDPKKEAADFDAAQRTRAVMTEQSDTSRLDFLKEQAKQPSLAAKQAYINGLEFELTQARKELAEARNAALEEAALAIDAMRWPKYGKEDSLAAIRSLKSKEPATPTEQEG